MSAKTDFINYIEDLLDYSSKLDFPQMNENVKMYWDAFRTIEEVEKPLFTENGKIILTFLQSNQDNNMWKARDIAESLGVSSRMVSGAARKLVTDGYIEKMGQEPVLYALTEKGKNIIID